jgi:hypothetical protein
VLVCPDAGLTDLLQHAIRKLGLRARNQRLREYGARRADVLGVPADPADDDHADSVAAGKRKRSRSPTPPPWEAKRRRQGLANGSLLAAVPEEGGGRTIVFGFGAGRLEAACVSLSGVHGSGG